MITNIADFAALIFDDFATRLSTSGHTDIAQCYIEDRLELWSKHPFAQSLDAQGLGKVRDLLFQGFSSNNITIVSN